MNIPYIFDQNRSFANKAVAAAFIPVFLAGVWVCYTFLTMFYFSAGLYIFEPFLALVLYGVPVVIAGIFLLWLFRKTSPK